MRTSACRAAALVVMTLVPACAAYSAELAVLASNGVKAALEALGPAFERESGHSLRVRFGLAAVLKREIEGGATFDVAILTRSGVAELAQQGKLDAGSEVDIARSAVGIGIRAGAARPDIATPEALKRTLLAARSIGWAREGASGSYFAGLLERMGIADEIMPKAVLAPAGADVGAMLASGKIELGALLVNELLAAPGVEVVGPLPPELQSYTVFTAAAAAAARDRAAAKALIRFLSSPDARAVFKAKGQEPG